MNERLNEPKRLNEACRETDREQFTVCNTLGVVGWCYTVDQRCHTTATCTQDINNNRLTEHATPPPPRGRAVGVTIEILCL